MPLAVDVFISLACTSKSPPSCGEVSSTISCVGVTTSTNSKALALLFTLTVLPPAPVKFAGVSPRPTNVVAPALAEIPASFVFSASVKALVSEFAS